MYVCIIIRNNDDLYFLYAIILTMTKTKAKYKKLYLPASQSLLLNFTKKKKSAVKEYEFLYN